MSQAQKPSISDLLASMRVVSIPLKSKFRGVNHREAVLFEGPAGWTEWSPFLEYEDDEAAVWLRAAIEFGWSETPAVRKDSIKINATVGAEKTRNIPGLLGAFGEFETVKIKVSEPGQTIVEDLFRVIRTHEFFPQAKIRIDANGGYSVRNAFEIANEIKIAGIELEYFEQPVRTIAEMAEARQLLSRIGVKVAADESVRKVSDPVAVAFAGAADILVLKAQPLGGIRSALEVARKANLPVTISSALETSVGISMGLHLAAAIDLPTFDAGLGTVAMFEDDVCDQPLIAKDGTLKVQRVIPSESKLIRLAASAERIDWWSARLERCLI